MTVLDAYALVAQLAGEPARTDVDELLRDRHDPSRISALNLGEVHDVVQRSNDILLEEVREKVTMLVIGGLEIVRFDRQDAERAGTLRAKHYHRARRPVAIADCAAAALAVRIREPLATADPHLAAMARDERIEVVPLPDSKGRRP